ncbi:hypothetical protein [Armatimonas sp.]|uniref:hypothetical protein n=1 Tax=Armatimonas sp. TaxID=1872638 RepID=UPI0037510042
MLRNIPTLWLNVLSGIGVFLCAGALFQGYQTNRRARYEQQRQIGMRQVVANAQPVIAAIRAYEKQHKKPLAKLEELEEEKKTLPTPGPMAESGHWDYGIEEGGKYWTLAIALQVPP